MTISPDEINDLRMKIVKGEDVSNDELRRAIQFHQRLRGRFAEAPVKEEKPKKESTKKKIDLDALGAELGL